FQQDRLEQATSGRKSILRHQDNIWKGHGLRWRWVCLATTSYVRKKLVAGSICKRSKPSYQLRHQGLIFFPRLHTTKAPTSFHINVNKSDLTPTSKPGFRPRPIYSLLFAGNRIGGHICPVLIAL